MKQSGPFLPAFLYSLLSAFMPLLDHLLEIVTHILDENRESFLHPADFLSDERVYMPGLLRLVYFIESNQDTSLFGFTELVIDSATEHLHRR